MFQRVATFLLALVLGWSALASQERSFLLAGAPVTAAQADADLAGPAPAAPADAAPAAENGSVDHHHLDDRPAQPADPAGDLPWFPATTLHLPIAAGPAQRHGSPTAGSLTQADSVLLRPPRG